MPATLCTAGCTLWGTLTLLPAILLACDATEGEGPPPGVNAVPQALSSIDCTESPDTGYVQGNPFPITLVTVDGKKVEVQTANAYYVMAQAAEKDGVNLKVVSGFRTMAEQTYFYNCYVNCNCNNCNLAAKPGYSNHQSGHALDLNASAAGVYSWLTTHGGTYGFTKTVASEDWHWEWWGGGPGGGPCGAPIYPRLSIKVSIVSVAGQERDVCHDGSSATIFDLWAGQQTDYLVDVTNQGKAPGKNVEVGLWSEAPYLEIRRWNILSDYNQPSGSFVINDTDGMQQLPHDKPGQSFTLWLGSISPGETKRIKLQVAAQQGSIGLADHPDIRAWIGKIEGYYAKSSYAAAPSRNEQSYQTQNGGDLRAAGQADVLDQETCDGRDNNCNGEVDEGCGASPDLGAPDGGVPGQDGGPDGGDSLGSGCAVGSAAGEPAPLLLLLLLPLLRLKQR